MKMRGRVFILFFCLGGVGAVYSLQAKPRIPKPLKQGEVLNLQTGEKIPIEANKATFPLYIYGDESGKKDIYIASGYMGDVSSLKTLTSVYDTSAPVSTGRRGKTSLKLEYVPKGRNGWVGLYWLTPANNWGKIKGAGYDLTGAKQLNFWIRGEKGGERIAVVKMGGIVGPYPDSDERSIGPLKLTPEWQEYSIPLEGLDLRHIVGGFAIIIRREDNPFGAGIFLDGIVYSSEAIDRGTKPSVSVTPGVSVSSAMVRVSFSSSSPLAQSVPKLDSPIHRVILFSTSTRGFGNEEQSILREVVELAKKYPTSTLVIEGHADGVGLAAVNLQLSRKRALMVGDYIRSQGLDPKRIMEVGYGAERPVATNSTAEGRSKNRRVEIIISPK